MSVNRSRNATKRCWLAALGSAVLFPVMSMAADTAGTAGAVSADALTLTPQPAQQVQADEQATAPNGGPLYLAAGGAAEGPNIHGFFNISFGTSYITPRGLVVQNAGIVIQPVAGLVIPIGDIGFLKNLTAVGGVWNSINSAENDERVGSWDEMDFFFSLSADIAPQISATLTYGAWSFPQSTLSKPETEHNIDLKIAYSDKWFGPDFSLNPYIDIFWAVEGSSTVVLGKAGETGYIEFGVVPTFKVKAGSYPITITMPTYVSFGPSEYWGGDNNFGVLSTAINASIPLTSIIPAKYGNWHLDAGVQYYNLLNGTLLDAGTILSGNTERNLFRGYVGIGFSF